MQYLILSFYFIFYLFLLSSKIFQQSGFIFHVRIFESIEASQINISDISG